ncbi:MAG: glycosyltransferase family 4 protein [Bacteroidia bacterium]
MAAHICHVSVLNPVLHPRIYYKQALSQVAWGYRVSIVAQGPRGVHSGAGVDCYPQGVFGRLSLRRLSYGLWVLPLLLRLRAQVYVLHSPELLGVGLLLKALRQARILYDVHEDYAANIRAAAHYPAWLRRPLAALLRVCERLALHGIDGVAYAEACYDDMLGAGPRRILLRNKFALRDAGPDTGYPLPPQPYLLYSGTLAADWGLWETFELWEALRTQPGLPGDLRLVIAGHSHQAGLLADLQARIAASAAPSAVHLIGGRDFVPHAQIVALIRHCWAGAGLYRVQPHIRDKIPTKFYEYLACGRPLIYTPGPAWTAFDAAHALGVAWAPGMPVAAVVAQVAAYAVGRSDRAAYDWGTEAEALRTLLQGWTGGPTTAL